MKSNYLVTIFNATLVMIITGCIITAWDDIHETRKQVEEIRADVRDIYISM